MDNSEAFAILRPVCVKLTKEIRNDNVDTLKKTLKLVNTKCLQDLQEYVLFPLRLILKSNKNEDLLQNVVEAITEILKATKIKKLDLFENILLNIVILISHPKDGGKIGDASEELKMAAVDCISILFENSTNDILKSFHAQFIAQLGHLVFVLVRLAENETNKQLRIKSIECLVVVSCCESRNKLKKIASRSFASFLPGICMSLCKIITGNITQGHSVLTVSLNAWARVVALVLGDSNLKWSKTDLNDKTVGNTKLPMINKSEEWVKDTASKLSILVDKIAELVSNSDWRVRLGLANWAGTLLIDCHKSLVNCAGPLFEVLITLSEDERTLVAKRSGEFLQQIDKSRPIDDLVQENIHNLITKLPRIFRISDDDKKLSTLRLLVGYVRILVILNENVDGLVLSYPQLSRLGRTLMQLTELECGNVQLLSEKSVCRVDLLDLDVKPTRKVFKHFRDEKIYSNFSRLCRLLGKNGDVNLLVDHCLELFHNSDVYKCQSVLLMTELLIGASEKMENDSSELIGVVKLLLDEYLQPSVWYLPVSLDSNAGEGANKSLQRVNSNVWLICLVLESIAAISTVLKGNFEPFLMDVLYPVLEKMGNELSVVSHSSFYCASVISSSVGCDSISELIYKNCDYLLNSLTLKLRHVECHPEVTGVMRVIFLNSRADVLGLIEDSIELLFNGLDNFHRETSEPFLLVLNTLMARFMVWFPNDDRPKKPSKTKRIDEKCLFDYFTEHHRLKLTEKGANVDEIEETDTTNDTTHQMDTINEREDENDENKPNFIKIAVETLKRCSHLLARKQLNFTLLVMDTIEKCVSILANWTDDLLPLIHQIWPEFKSKFSDENLIVVKRACDVLVTIARACGDFARKRTVEQIWPKLTQFLRRQAQISDKNTSSAYAMTSAYKLQLRELSCLGKLIADLEISGERVDSVVEVCVPYLSNRQPIALQEMAVETMVLCAGIEPDVVWLVLRRLDRSLGDLEPLDSDFRGINVIALSHDSTMYEENVAAILKEIA